MSSVMASSQPPPRHQPLTAAMIGFPIFRTRSHCAIRFARSMSTASRLPSHRCPRPRRRPARCPSPRSRACVVSVQGLERLAQRVHGRRLRARSAGRGGSGGRARCAPPPAVRPGPGLIRRRPRRLPAHPPPAPSATRHSRGAPGRRSALSSSDRSGSPRRPRSAGSRSRAPACRGRRATCLARLIGPGVDGQPVAGVGHGLGPRQVAPPVRAGSWCSGSSPAACAAGCPPAPPPSHQIGPRTARLTRPQLRACAGGSPRTASRSRAPAGRRP